MDGDARVSKLNKLFNSVCYDGAKVTKSNSSRFLESIRAQSHPATCLNKIVSSASGLASLQTAMSIDLSDSFLNGDAVALLTYLQAPDLPNIGGGIFLRKVLEAVVDPPLFWDIFTSALESLRLSPPGVQCFAWLLLQLVQLPDTAADPYIALAGRPKILSTLTQSADKDTKRLALKLQNIVETRRSPVVVGVADDDSHPGGRHDNDFPDFRKIAILPTADEITCDEAAFLRRTSPSDCPDPTVAVAQCLDGQFRLLREDMLYEIKDELQIAFKKKSGHHRGLAVEGFTLLPDAYSSENNRVRCFWGIKLQANDDLSLLKNKTVGQRKSFLDEHRNYFKHQAHTCLLVDDEVVAFPMIHRDEDLLARIPPIVVLQLDGKASTMQALVRMRKSKHPKIKIIQIDTAIFSYEPILKALQHMLTMPLFSELLCWNDASRLEPPDFSPAAAVVPGKHSLDHIAKVVKLIRRDPGADVSELLGIAKPKPIILDGSQAKSLLAGLTQRVSLIQGPPGTGKSFIGALLAKVLHTAERAILVVCYTNHALDQFLEDLLDIGVPAEDMVRLGGKSTTRTEPLLISKQRRGANMGHMDWNAVNSTEMSAARWLQKLKENLQTFATKFPDLLEHIEFEEPDLYEALSVPSDDEMTVVGRDGKEIDRSYLLDRWSEGKDAGIFASHPSVRGAPEVWNMHPDLRRAKVEQWRNIYRMEQAETISTAGDAFNRTQREISRVFAQRDLSILKSKKIIGCTTTAAAKYCTEIRAASPEVLLVEEAGEILESHIITALGSETKQIILIGDHKQLRPKVNNYTLTIEKGDGFELNRSLFERLVLKGYPHEVLRKQHRMRPEISALIRRLTYPELVDADSTKSRPNVRGLRDNLVFINHSKPEDENKQFKNQILDGSKSSKRNSFEALMVMKIVKYLGQQGYGTDKLVVLTPYLGQLQELREVLKKENDPVLNDLDSYDLVCAGLMPAPSADTSKRKLRLATIDNYQGEQSDIVISCLTRSNPSHDIGFMFSPERLNVLLSRPRNAFIMIGNSHTFMNSRKGKDLWTTLFDMLKDGGHIYDGLPVRCERHPDRTAVLKAPKDFDQHCPDGGCKEACGTRLKCGRHVCPSKCHQLSDHSKMECKHILRSKCPRKHPQTYHCSKGPPANCNKCDHEDKLAEEKRRRDYELEQKREAAEQEYKDRLAAIDAKIAAQKAAEQDVLTQSQRKHTLEQRERDLEDIIARVNRPPVPPPSPTSSSPSAPKSPPSRHPKAKSSIPPIQQPVNASNKPSATKMQIPASTARAEWQRQKDLEGARNAAIDAIMKMIGLEEVKDKILEIKAKIDTSLRQNASLKDERFNTTFLGNPGTGKTTVARHYAKFLATVGILPGDELVETTGARLSNEGVTGAKKIVEKLLNDGGGTIFVDEAYQLTGPHSQSAGRQVLEFLLAEMENNTGKIVFIFAGYAKEMESFFEHNPGLRSRVPHQFTFADYSDPELLAMLEQLIWEKYSGNMKVEDGTNGLYARIAVRRLGRGRGSPGFGNARALANMFATVTGRQATRLNRQRREGLKPDDFLFTSEDLIGPNPAEASLRSKAWEKLQKLIGLKSVKESVSSMLSMIETNYERELREEEPLQLSLNQVFFGSPGTGKTSVAKLYGEILADLGLISKREVVAKNPADFVGDVLGASETKTKAILASTVGKVLVIDEAYMLYNGNSAGGGGQTTDPFKMAVIDTIVAEVQSVPGEDRCVLLLGYEKQMTEMFQNVNPGLSRRFNVESAFYFEDFDDAELVAILELKLESQHLDATDAGKKTAIEVLSRERVRPNFGNGGAVENLLGLAKKRYQSRHKAARTRYSSIVFEPQDFDPEFDRGSHASTNLTKLFEDVVGCEEIIAKLARYQATVQNAKLHDLDWRNLIPTNWVFKGPPGTGKTTVARKMGQVYFDMGFLSSADVEECRASDLIGQYVGHTGPKTTKLLEKALGRVLFIDEAYQLAGGTNPSNNFTQEAVDELVGMLTNPKFQSKMVVILAGYDADMNRLLSVNSGLASRFSGELTFPNMDPDKCLGLLKKDLEKSKVVLDSASDKEIVNLIHQMSCLQGWGNARDVKTIAKEMVGIALTSPPGPGKQLVLQTSDAVACVRRHLDSLGSRVSVPIPPHRVHGLAQSAPPPPSLSMPPPMPPPAYTATATQNGEPEPTESENEDDGRGGKSGRDAGVSDAVWKQLQEDIKAAEVEQRWRQEELERAEQAAKEAKEEEQRRIAEVKRMEQEARDAEAKRKLEELRLRALAARQERERLEREREARRQAEEAARQRDAKAQARLQQMGVCVAGFRWIKQLGGYRCAGGAHWVTDQQLGM
ncbi:P-loop containing nucleoside triphosphate hydrolase protein [Favolaschia claudopus]|uniref:P-loop containing nucleoside triphosphate hydrolase protein n=1 Tax=Favolaschia claudopus TaxID=2862362 RepID=A0AAW0BGM2_9AGAR